MIYRGNSETSTLWLPKDWRSKSAGYCLMPNVISTAYIWVFGQKKGEAYVSVFLKKAFVLNTVFEKIAAAYTVHDTYKLQLYGKF